MSFGSAREASNSRGIRALLWASFAACYRLYRRHSGIEDLRSRDNGDSWSIIADVAPVSKGEFYRALVKDRVKLANVDDIVVSAAAAARFANIQS
jgi:hypothetical protein